MKREALRRARKEAGLTQAQMAARLGYRSKGQYCMLELGKRRLTVENGLAIAAILGKPFEALFGDSAAA